MVKQMDEGYSISRLQNDILLIFKIWKIRNIGLVRNLIVSTSCEFDYNDISVASFVTSKARVLFNTWQVVKEWAEYCTDWLCSMNTWCHNNDAIFIKISSYMCPIKLCTKPIFPSFQILKIDGIMPFCNLCMERLSYFSDIQSK